MFKNSKYSASIYNRLPNAVHLHDTLLLYHIFYMKFVVFFTTSGNINGTHYTHVQLNKGNFKTFLMLPNTLSHAILSKAMHTVPLGWYSCSTLMPHKNSWDPVKLNLQHFLTLYYNITAVLTQSLLGTSVILDIPYLKL